LNAVTNGFIGKFEVILRNTIEQLYKMQYGKTWLVYENQLVRATGIIKKAALLRQPLFFLHTKRTIIEAR